PRQYLPVSLPDALPICAGDDLGTERDGAVTAHHDQGGERVAHLLGASPGHRRGRTREVHHRDAGQPQQMAHLPADAVCGPLGRRRVGEQAHPESAHRRSSSASSRREGPSMLLAWSSSSSSSSAVPLRRSWIIAIAIAPKNRPAIALAMTMRVMGSGVGTITAVKTKLMK